MISFLTKNRALANLLDEILLLYPPERLRVEITTDGLDLKVYAPLRISLEEDFTSRYSLISEKKVCLVEDYDIHFIRMQEMRDIRHYS